MNGSLVSVEQVELHYLRKYYHFLKFAEDELFKGFKTKESLKSDWIGQYKSGISDFSVGAERIVYALLNGKGIGQPNSAPVGSDLFFEVDDAFIHFDLKTVAATLYPRKSNHPDGAWSNNIGDCTKSIFVGPNQNSYRGEILQKDGLPYVPKRLNEPSLPTHYNSGTEYEKVCLSYFLTILYDKDTLDILMMSIACMPNGSLEPHYKSRVLQAGKNTDKTRFRFSDVSEFELLPNKPKRIRVTYFNKEMHDSYRKRLKFHEKLFELEIG